MNEICVLYSSVDVRTYVRYNRKFLMFYISKRIFIIRKCSRRRYGGTKWNKIKLIKKEN